MSDSFAVRIVPPLNRNMIRKDAYQLRLILGLKDTMCFPIMEVLEWILPKIYPRFYVEPVPDEILIGIYAETIPEQHTIRVKQSVYDAACRGLPWARKIMAHELAHYIYHDSNHVAYAKAIPGKRIPKQFSPEYQADVFASELLAPIHLIRGMTPRTISQKCGVPVGMAEGQIREASYTRAGRKKKRAAKQKRSTAHQ